MDWRQRMPFFLGAGLGVAVGLGVGQATGWRSEVRKSPSLQAIFSESPAGMSDLGGVEPLPQIDAERPLPPSAPVPGGAMVLNEPDFGEDPVHADAVVTAPTEGAELFPSEDRSQPSDAPQQLQVAGAKPISPPEPMGSQPPSPTGDEPTEAPVLKTPSVEAGEAPVHRLSPVIIEILGDELKGVSEQQQEVWADALQGLPPGDAIAIIRMWKNFGDSSANPLGAMRSPFPALGIPGKRVPDTLPSGITPEVPARSDSQTNVPDQLPPSDLRVIRSADWLQRIARHNAGNVDTCGYLNLVPVNQELPLEEGSAGATVVGCRLDVRPGRYVKTGNPSHVAVQRQTFFAVRISTGEEWYTRVGRLVLDAERRLCVDLGDEDLPLVPEIKLPEAVTRFVLLGDSVQVQVPGQADPQSIGLLQVAEFFDASRLEPKGRSLYAATTASGKARLVPAELIQETLEYPARVAAEGPPAVHE